MGDEPSLYEGDADVSGWVETLQLALRRAGHDPGPIDGKFGWRTAQAVVAFQQERQLQSNGVVGNESWAALLERDPEPPGVNNGPHGGLVYPPTPHAEPPLRIHGVGTMPEPAELTFVSDATFDGDTVSVDLAIAEKGPGSDLVLSVWAELY